MNLDELVAEKVLGWRKFPTPTKEGDGYYDADGIGIMHALVAGWSPTTDIVQAIGVLARFRQPKWEWAITNDNINWYEVRIACNSQHLVDEHDESLPLAICRAVLVAGGVDIYAES